MELPGWWCVDAGMAAPLVSDELWALIAPLIPPKPPKPKGGRPPITDRAALTGILFVLKSGIPWEMLPAEMGCGSGMTCWRRLREWQQAGIWERVHPVLLERLGDARAINWSRAILDGADVPAKGERRGGPAEDGHRQPDRAGEAGHKAPHPHRRGQDSPRAQSRERPRQPTS